MTDKLCTLIRFGGRRNLFAITALVCFSIFGPLATSSAEAQQNESTMADLIEGFQSETAPEVNAPLPASTTSPLNVGVQWRLSKRVIDDGATATSELLALQNDATSLGIASLPTYQMALIARVEQGQLNLNEREVEQLIDSAHHLAPHLPYAQLAMARYRFHSNPVAVHRAIAPYVKGLRLGYSWLDTRVQWGLKGAVALLFAAGIGFLGFLLAQLLRYFGIAAYDGTRVLPRGFSSTQTVVLLMAVVLAPGLLLQSPLLSLILLLLLVIPFQQINERIVSVLFLGLLAALPFIDDALGQMMTYPGSDAQKLLHAHYHGCTDECLPWLEALAKQDPHVAGYAHAVQRFRVASQEEMQALQVDLAGRSPSSGALEGAWLNLEGAVLIARGHSDEAVDVLDRAIATDPQRPEPWFNQMRALQILGESNESHEAFAQALRVDLPLVSRKLQNTRRDPASYLMVTPLSADEIWAAHAPSADHAPSLVTPFWTAAAGEKVPLQWAQGLSFLGFLILLASLPLYLRRKISTPCPKCSLARDPTDSEATNHHHYCLPCYQTFVSGATLDYHARVHSEVTLGRRDRFQAFMRRFLSLVLPGVGHILGGHALRGMLALTAIVAGTALLIFPMGLWRGAFELFYEHWAGQHVLAWVLISIGASVGLTGLVRGIDPTRTSTRRQPTGGPR